jgi:hypothetical protein
MKDRQSRKRNREGDIRAPSSFTNETAGMIWRVGALREHLSCYMCVDTGAMNELMIIREKRWWEST